jgi:hypothetical protein
MADWEVAKATGWADLLAVHDQWVSDYNYQSHWAHQERTDGRLTPRDVLGWVNGRQVTADAECAPPPEEMEVALVAPGQVAHPDPASAQGMRRGAGIVQVSAHETRRSDDELAWFVAQKLPHVMAARPCARVYSGRQPRGSANTCVATVNLEYTAIADFWVASRRMSFTCTFPGHLYCAVLMAWNRFATQWCTIDRPLVEQSSAIADDEHRERDDRRPLFPRPRIYSQEGLRWNTGLRWRMPVCIAGMHRSGTSMVARLLHICGLYLGDESDLVPPAPDNPEGYWENLRFVRINDEVLNILGGAWDTPPVVAADWGDDSRLAQCRQDASMLTRAFADREPWGWKDPRNSLTLPFWRHLLTGMRVVICVRNPLAVAQSLNRRHFTSYHLGLRLWGVTNMRLLDAVPPDARIVTHYDAYFRDPQTELRRVLDFLEMDASERDIEHACATVFGTLRHHDATSEDLLGSGAHPWIDGLYATLCTEIGMEISPSAESRAPRATAPVADSYRGEPRISVRGMPATWMRVFWSPSLYTRTS